jgi:translocation and assembly module TamB
LPVGIALLGDGGPWWRVDERAPLNLALTSTRNSEFWQQVDAALGILLEEPEFNGGLGGTWGRPTGEVTLSAARIEVDEDRWGPRWPELREFRARLVGGDDGLVLEALEARVIGQQVRASGRLPLDRASLAALRKDPFGYLESSGSARIEILNADLAAWSALAPNILAPIGTLALALEVEPGAEVRGSLRLDGAATRPLGPLGALQDVTARMSFAGRTLTIDSVNAQTGGRPVVLKGQATWPRDAALSLDLSLAGQNLPIVRQPGLLLRGDVDLKVRTESDSATWVRGGVRLRDGLFLVDLKSLRPNLGGRTAGPARRPPYFSVEASPFAEWRLDVAVTGNRFMRIETPVFSAKASADFKLGGNLREPRAVGEVTLPEGRVKLPFATFEVIEGWVRLTEADPYAPRLSLVGTAQRLGYDLRMELGGAASNPELKFFSSPPLASEKVLLLVMAGEAPQDEVTYSSSQRATKLGTYLGQSLLNQFTGNSRGEDRFTISTGEKVSREGRETYRVEYELDRRWSVLGEYDEFDDFNAGVKWKVFAPRVKETDAQP